MRKYQFLDRRVPIEDGNIALVQDLSKCKNCSLCRKACAVDMGVFDYKWGCANLYSLWSMCIHLSIRFH